MTEKSDIELVSLGKSRLPIGLPHEEFLFPPSATNQVSVVRNIWLHKKEIWLFFDSYNGCTGYKRKIDRETLINILENKVTRIS